MEDIDIYKLSSSYENFMLRALQINDNSKKGVHMSNMQNLFRAESDESDKKYQEQLLLVKTYLNKGFDKLLSRRMKADLKEKFKEYRNEMQFITNPSNLVRIINDSLSLINENDL